MPQPSRVDRQREHQANERTFLAWLRTSITLIGFGFAIARFGLFLQQFQTVVNPQQLSQPPQYSEALGLSLVVVGIALMILATWRFNQVFWQIERANYQPSRFLVILTAGVVVVLGALSIPFILLQPGNRPPKPRSHQPQSRASTIGIRNHLSH